MTELIDIDPTTKHEQVSVIIDRKKINIDIKILPVVNWVNSFYGAKTNFSCCGENNYTLLPFVSFRCKNKNSVNKIKSVLKNFQNKYKAEEMTLNSISEFKNNKEHITYVIYFISRNDVEKFTKYIEKDNNED